MIISVLNLKGGSGKTTVSTNLAVALTSHGKRVLIIDTDKQGSSLRWISERESNEKKINLISLPDSSALKKQIFDFQTGYDAIIIDGAPQIDILATVSIAISDIVLLPVGPSPYDIWSTEIMIERIDLAKQIQNDIKDYFIINRYSQRTRLSRETEEALNKFETPVLKTKLGHRTSYPDSALSGLSVLEWNDAKAKKEVLSLGSEIMEIGALL